MELTRGMVSPYSPAAGEHTLLISKVLWPLSQSMTCHVAKCGACRSQHGKQRETVLCYQQECTQPLSPHISAALTNNRLTKHSLRLPSLWQSTGSLTNWKGKCSWGLCQARREGFLSHLQLKCKTLDFSYWPAELMIMLQFSVCAFLSRWISHTNKWPSSNKTKQTNQNEARYSLYGNILQTFLWTSTEGYYTLYACSVGNVDKNIINSLNTQEKKKCSLLP